jgi:hypothetical protein
MSDEPSGAEQELRQRIERLSNQVESTNVRWCYARRCLTDALKYKQVYLEIIPDQFGQELFPGTVPTLGMSRSMMNLGSTIFFSFQRSLLNAPRQADLRRTGVSAPRSMCEGVTMESWPTAILSHAARVYSWCGDNAELVQQAQLVRNRPAFHDLAVGDAVNVDSRHTQLLAGGGNALVLARATHTGGPAGHHPVPCQQL